GDTHKKRIDTLVRDMIENTIDRPTSQLSAEKMEAMNDLRTFMFKNVYHNSRVKRVEDINKVKEIVEFLYSYYLENHDELPRELLAMRDEFSIEELVKDHVAGMTDRYALNTYEELTKNFKRFI
ncbi:MAG: deoxyguanosinetriphosphate triphosphohydrolase, partial [Firmicutes bacterium]|nr:deoxyguanosinetriphosphate triphosphohydrolase [Bacillota bacterium]